jgi:transferase CAF17, mitochondrial
LSRYSAVLLQSRGVLRIAGTEARSFLQGMISNDMEKLAPNRAIWAAFLTPQGRFLHDLFLTQPAASASGDELVLIDCEAARRGDLQHRLGIYKLRAKVALEDATADYRIAALFGDGALATLGLAAEAGCAAAFAGGMAYVDPRLPALGARAILPTATADKALADAGFELTDLAAYDALRIGLGIPDGSRDMEVEKALLLENGFDELHGIDWEKGCYVGQELTARTKYRGLVKKRLLPVEIDGPRPPPNTPVMLAGKEAGVMRTAVDRIGLALLRVEYLEALATDALTAGEARLTPRKPPWATF